MTDCEKCLHYEVCDRSSHLIWNEIYKKECTDFMGWIPVSERLPEVGTGEVLVARSYKGKPYVDVGEFINGTACCWGDEYAINPREHITTHWMPLPEPPKED